MFDILIHNGKIIDGSGSPAFKGDVGMNSGRISAIGDLSAAKSKGTMDAANLVVAQGLLTFTPIPISAWW
jgi:N-acyl-D-amino-acid deacylase